MLPIFSGRLYSRAHTGGTSWIQWVNKNKKDMTLGGCLGALQEESQLGGYELYKLIMKFSKTI